MSLRVAIVGCGNIAHAHIPAIQGAAGVEVAGLYDADRTRAEVIAAQFGIGVVYDDWSAVLRDSAVDIVGLLLPHQLHGRFGVEALTAGKHVMCEKPLAVTLAECDALIATAERSQRALMPCHTRLFEPVVPYLRDLLDRGVLGPLYLAQTCGVEPPSTPGVRPWLGSQPGDGVLMAQAVHAAYLLRHLVGPVVEVSCFHGQVKVVDLVADDTSVVLLRFASGAVAEMTATFGQRIGPHEIGTTLYGRDGWATFPAGGRRLTIAAEHLFGDDQPHLIEPAAPPNFQAMWSAFAAALATGQPPPVTGADGRAAVAIILAAYRSAASGQPVRLPPV
jgi:predicted dehydrogenase